MNKRLLGIIGAILGGFVFTIPWILVYIFGDMLFAILAAFIAFGALLGYKKLGGPVDKKTPIIIVIVSVLVIIVTTTIIIPLCLLSKEGYIVSFHNLQVLYDITKFRNAIIHDLIISVIFTFLGISGVISKLRSEVDPNYVQNVQNAVLGNTQKREDVKNAFLKYHAMDKYNTVSKETILSEINNDIKLFNQLKIQQIIKKSHGKYYFSEKAEKSVLYRFAIIYIRILALIAIIVAVLISIMYFTN